MGASLYYFASRSTPLTPDEASLLATLVDEFNMRRAKVAPDDLPIVLERDDLEPGQVLCGATTLPGDSDALWSAIQHGCDCLTALRRNLSGRRVVRRGGGSRDCVGRRARRLRPFALKMFRLRMEGSRE
ncbi:MAG: hypothetical protein H6721_32490 [Sandaracinus sp.]|nr:hypothetical protein [Sandaracinus sp.]MCB9625080.1 hypothetical protein [Sandaracinus sp.]MCB9636855.1 hypothetical protein [Sandaracinus sp.]